MLGQFHQATAFYQHSGGYRFNISPLAIYLDQNRKRMYIKVLVVVFFLGSPYQQYG